MAIFDFGANTQMNGGDYIMQPFMYKNEAKNMGISALDSAIGLGAGSQSQLGSGSLAQSAANSYGMQNGLANAANQVNYYDTIGRQQYVSRTVTTTTSYPEPGVVFTTVAAGEWQPVTFQSDGYVWKLQPAVEENPKDKPITALDVLEKEGNRMIEV